MRLRYRNRQYFLNDRGNSLFELVVFLPLFLIFIVVVVDFGLAFQEHATLRNAQRALQNVAVAQITTQSISATTQSFETTFDQQLAQSLLDSLLADFAADVTAEKSIGDASAPQFSVQAALLLLPVDQHTGEALSTDFDAMMLAYSELPRQNQALEASSIRSKHYLEPKVFIAQNLDIAARHIPSLYARPLVAAVGNVEAHFAAQTVLLYLEVSAETSGLKRFGVYSFLGRFFTLQDQQLLVLRE